MNLSRPEAIAHILQQRRPLAEQLASTIANLETLNHALHDLATEKERLWDKIEDPQVRGRLQELDFHTLARQVESQALALDRLQSRFQRPTLNIGVIGRARQGKSRLLQSLTGLTAAEIPDGDRQHCTGVRSTIHHNPNTETYGEVWFHRERSFLDEVIAPYYDKLGLGKRPLSLEEFANSPLPPLPENLAGYAEPGAMYEHLGRYHQHLPEYRHLLFAPSPQRISKEEIRAFVAQDTPDGKRIFFNYLAVAEVKITCSFPNDTVGQIALVDMPGLGDTGMGDEQRLVRTLGRDVDAVLFVRSPKSTGDYWADVDVRLYDLARDALVELPLEQWSFLVLNHTAADSKNGDNLDNCQDLADSAAEKHIIVADTAIVNCARPDETNTFLDRVLEYLQDHIVQLDRTYATTRQAELSAVQTAIATQLQTARTALDCAPRTGRANRVAAGENWFPLFEQLFEQLWGKLTVGLEKLLGELRQQRDSRDSDFKTQVEATLNTARTDTGIPTLEEIEIRRDRVGGYPNAYYQYLNEVRAHLSQHFLLLDEGLKKGLERVKDRVAQVLIEAGLAGISDKSGTEYLSAFAQLIPDRLLDRPSALKRGFIALATFELSYRGTIQHRIRRHLDDLTPDETSLQLSHAPTAPEVLNCLKTLHAESLYRCETALDDLLAEPSLAAFAIVEEFLDRVLRARNVKTEWRIFLEEMRAEIWTAEFAALGDRSRRRRQWLEAIERADKVNSSSPLIL